MLTPSRLSSATIRKISATTNGAGKTTLMMTIAGILAPRRGSVRLEGNELIGRSPAGIVAQGVALVPENRLVFPHMSVHENLLAGAYQRRDRAGIAADLERMYGRFPQLRERRAQLAGTLSGGEQQMLAVARALMSRPRLLLMDEPSLGLAPLVVAEIFRIVAELNQSPPFTNGLTTKNRQRPHAPET